MSNKCENFVGKVELVNLKGGELWEILPRKGNQEESS